MPTSAAAPRHRAMAPPRSAPRSSSRRIGAWVLTLAALIALAITLWRYLTPLSGITGERGALLAMLGEAALAVAGVLLTRAGPGFWRGVLLALSWVGLLLTGLAVLFLHGWWTAVVLGIGLLGLATASFAPRRTGDAA